MFISCSGAENGRACWDRLASSDPCRWQTGRHLARCFLLGSTSVYSRSGLRQTTRRWCTSCCLLSWKLAGASTSRKEAAHSLVIMCRIMAEPVRLIRDTSNLLFAVWRQRCRMKRSAIFRDHAGWAWSTFGRVSPSAGAGDGPFCAHARGRVGPAKQAPIAT